jgi:hypothetical protein
MEERCFCIDKGIEKELDEGTVRVYGDGDGTVL